METKFSGEPKLSGHAAKARSAGQRQPSRVVEPVNNRMPISSQIHERLRSGCGEPVRLARQKPKRPPRIASRSCLSFSLSAAGSAVSGGNGEA